MKKLIMMLVLLACSLHAQNVISYNRTDNIYVGNKLANRVYIGNDISWIQPLSGWFTDIDVGSGPIRVDFSPYRVATDTAASGPTVLGTNNLTHVIQSMDFSNGGTWSARIKTPLIGATVCFWLYVTELIQDSNIYMSWYPYSKLGSEFIMDRGGYFEEGLDIGWGLGYYDSKKLAIKPLSFGDTSNSCSNTEIALNQWQHWAVTTEGEYTKFYLNGQLDRAVIMPFDYGMIQNEYTDGAFSIGGGTKFKLADFRTYKTQLTAAQIQSVFNQFVSVTNSF